MSEHFYPTLTAESLYGDFLEAWSHLENKLIATRKPEEIRGGGLLTYCDLLVRGYAPVREIDIQSMERYMCSRFFIDFRGISQQRQKLETYLANHFIGDAETKYDYLTTLYRVVYESSVCLMNDDLHQTLNLILQLAYQVYMTKERRDRIKMAELSASHQLNSLVIGQTFNRHFMKQTLLQLYLWIHDAIISLPPHQQFPIMTILVKFLNSS